MSDMTDLENWREVTEGLFRYVIAPGACYEIHVQYYLGSWNADKEDKLRAQSSLYIVGDWYNHKTKVSYFERECLEDKLPLFECLEAAKADYEQNHIEDPQPKPTAHNDCNTIKAAVEENYHTEIQLCNSESDPPVEE